MGVLLGTIVDHKLATLNELQTIYSYADALDMYEVIAVSNYNNYIASGGK